MAEADSMSAPATLHETPVERTKRLPPASSRTDVFSPAKLFADYAMAARLWFWVACAAVAFCLIEPYLIIRAYRAREKVVVLDGAGTFAISPLLGFEDAKALHESMSLWATLALLQRNPRDFDYPELLRKLYLADAYAKAQADLAKSRPEFELKNIHQKPEVFKIDILRTRANVILARVEGQLIRTGVFENQTFTESPRFTLDLTLVRNPDMLANKRYPLGVWRYDFHLD